MIQTNRKKGPCRGAGGNRRHGVGYPCKAGVFFVPVQHCGNCKRKHDGLQHTAPKLAAAGQYQHQQTKWGKLHRATLKAGLPGRADQYKNAGMRARHNPWQPDSRSQRMMCKASLLHESSWVCHHSNGTLTPPGKCMDPGSACKTEHNG